MKARRKFRQSKSHAVAWAVLALAIALIFICFQGVSSVFATYNNWTNDLPTDLDISDIQVAEESYMYASDGKTQLAKFQTEKHKNVELSKISEYAIKGTVDIEDVRFYEHNGVDPQGIVRAVVNNLTGGSLEGASTITQQLIRNTVLSTEANDITLARKAREAELALELEKKYSKDEILNMYLNTVSYGDGCYGIESAAQNYFQTSAADLSLVQAATLVGIPQAPTDLNPKEHPEECLARRNLVLDRMLTAGDITQQQHDEAVASKLNLNPAKDEPLQGLYAYPYFTSYVRDELVKEGNIYGCSDDLLYTGGLRIYTTLDVDMQKQAEEACNDQYGNMDDTMEAALVAMDPTTGYVKAIVGGNDFYTDQWNIATQGGRPSGSTFKVFTLAAAIESGISPQAAIDCSNPVKLSNGQEINNFDKANYGMRSISDATAISSNTGYYRLTEKIGVDKLTEMAHRLGIDSDLSPYPIIVLGTENVTPLEMAEAYSSIASGGVHREPVVITRIEDSDGNILFENADTSERVLEESVAGAVTEVLRGVFEKSYATAYGAGPSNGQTVAGKTGTGVEYRDHWLVGYSPTLTCAAWIGNRDYSSTSESLTANSLWHDFMSRALDGTEITQFPTFTQPVYNTTQSEMLMDGSNMTTNTQQSTTTTNSNSNASDQVQNEIDNYQSGSMTEDELEKKYQNYDVEVSYAYSSEYPEGAVISQQYDPSTGTITTVVSQGPNPSGNQNNNGNNDNNTNNGNTNTNGDGSVDIDVYEDTNAGNVG